MFSLISPEISADSILTAALVILLIAVLATGAILMLLSIHDRRVTPKSSTRSTAEMALRSFENSRELANDTRSHHR